MGSKTSSSVPQPTAEERELIAKQVELAEFQIGELQRQRQAQERAGGELDLLSRAQLSDIGLEPVVGASRRVRNPEFAGLKAQIASLEAQQASGRSDSPLDFILSRLPRNRDDQPAAQRPATVNNAGEIARLRAQLANTPEFITEPGRVESFKRLPPSEDQVAREAAQRETRDLLLADLRRGGEASPEQIALIDEATGAALESGLTDIERFRSESLDALREELAPALGLRPSDTPILDRGARVAAEATRQSGQLSSNLRAAGAQARLTLPLETSRVTQAAGLGLSQLTEATRQFQEMLRQQAFTNRLSVAGQSGNLGLGLAGNPSASISGALEPLTRTRLGATTTSTSDPFGTLISGAGAVGGLASGLGAVGVFSSKALKEEKEPVDEDDLLAALKEIPVERWRYKPGLGLGRERHIGPYAEDMRDRLGVGDGTMIPVVDAIGIGLAATKALARKVERLERSESEGMGLAA